MARELATMTDQRDAAMQCHEWCRKDRKRIIKELIKVTEQRDRLADALRSIKNELGVPQPEYPAPVAHAVKIADEALNQLKPRQSGRRISNRISNKPETMKHEQQDLDDFIFQQIKNLEDFENEWRLCNRKDEKNYPLEMFYGDWIEQLLIYGNNEH
jgi:hypothetical protein